jgi:hypothetical protein
MTQPIPSVNVNTKRCDCGGASPDGKHAPDCPGIPILIPCPIPRSVTFQVTLGECDCFRSRYVGKERLSHAVNCPERPANVSCSIYGATWAESDAVQVQYSPSPGRLEWYLPAHPVHATCRARWALVKALVLGHDTLHIARCGPNMIDLTDQRDNVFAALADMDRAEEKIEAAKHSFFGALHRHGKTIVRTARPSHGMLETYVERLIEQVGVLGT